MFPQITAVVMAAVELSRLTVNNQALEGEETWGKNDLVNSCCVGVTLGVAVGVLVSGRLVFKYTGCGYEGVAIQWPC